MTHICPVYEGFALPHLTRRLDIAGAHADADKVMLIKSILMLMLILITLMPIMLMLMMKMVWILLVLLIAEMF